MKIKELFEAKNPPGETVKAFVIHDKKSDKYVRLTFSWGGTVAPIELSDADFKGQSKAWPSWDLSPAVHQSGLWSSESAAKKLITRLSAMKTLDVETLKPAKEFIDKETGEIYKSDIPAWKRLKNKYKKLSKLAQELDLEVQELEVPKKMTKVYGLHK